MTPDTGTYTLRRGEHSFGPYTAAEVAAYLATGNIVPSDALFDHDAQQWITVQALLARHGTVPGAMSNGPAAHPMPPVAPAGAPPGFDPAMSFPGAEPPGSRRSDAVTALIMGLLAMVCCGPLFGVLAIVFGLRGMKDPINRGMAIAGFVLGIVGVVVGTLGTLFYLLAAIL